VCAPDLPGHGRSGWLAHYDLPALAGAVAEWMRAADLAGAHVVGHSLGGKVAMQLALSEPALVRSLVVADIAPVAYGRRHDSVFAGLRAVTEAVCRDRGKAADVLSRHLDEAE